MTYETISYKTKADFFGYRASETITGLTKKEALASATIRLNDNEVVKVQSLNREFTKVFGDR